MKRVPNQPIKWHGGKSYLANWIHQLAPPSCIVDPVNGYTHRNIVFAGGLGEFWNWEPVEGISEAINDLDGELTNFWTVLAWPEYFKHFLRIVQAFPMSEPMRAQWSEWFKTSGHHADVEWMIPRAVEFFVRIRQSRQGLGKCYATPTTRTRRGMNENVSAWLSSVEGLPDAHQRMIRAEVRNEDFAKFIQQYDHKRALFYCDPTYMPETRSTVGEYGNQEMTPDDHNRLLDVLHTLKGKFMLSGYRCDYYDERAALHGWHRVEKLIDNKASSSKTKEKRIECLWLNYEPPQLELGVAA